MQRTMTYAELWRPTTQSRAIAYDTSMVLGGSLLIALCAQISFWLPFSPVPVTGQTLAVLLVGFLLGSRKGALSVLAYLTEGSLGLPFFAGGKAGFVALAGVTGGYLMGFVLAAFVVGWLAERGWDRHFWTSTLAMVIGTALIFAGGLAWLAAFVPSAKLLSLGFYPFLPGAAVKIALGAVMLPLGWKIGSRQ